MKKIVFIILTLLAFAGQFAWANPPSLVELEYNNEDEVLNINVQHKTYDLTEHRIRRLVIYVNGEEKAKYRFVKQPTASRLIKKLPLKVEEGDEIRVKATCSEAGYKETTLIISKKK